jgi:HD superfamily phosphohydrolase
MYWQVYLHKTVLSAEMMLVKIIRRAKELINKNTDVNAATKALNFFLKYQNIDSIEQNLDIFCRLDDYDVMCTVKNWADHSDKILSVLCRSLVDRKLLKVRFQSEPYTEKIIDEKKKIVAERFLINKEETDYFVFTGEAINTTYDPGDERIQILFKDGSVKDISQVDNALIHYQISSAVKKFYLCYLGN